jgi:hypothetical protein
VTYQIISDGAGGTGRRRVTIFIESAKTAKKSVVYEVVAGYRGFSTPLSQAVMRANGQAGGEERGRHLPTEVCEFLVDALESHGDLCGLCGGFGCRKRFRGVERECVVEELKWAASRVSAFILI